MSATSLESSLLATIAALRAENAALRAALSVTAVAWPGPPSESLVDDETDAGHSLPDNRDVERLLTYVSGVRRMYAADPDEVPTHDSCMDGLASGSRIDVCMHVLPAIAAGVHYTIHPSRLFPAEIYFVRDDCADRAEDFFAFYFRCNGPTIVNRIYRSLAGLQAALTALYGSSAHSLVVRMDRDGLRHAPL